MKRRFIIVFGIVCVVVLATLLGYANWPGTALPPDALADRIVVLKFKRQLELHANGKVLKCYVISLGRHPVGPKQREGDKRTPEGIYAIESHRANSSFHKALKVSYPSPADRAAAEKRGEAPGSDIMVHGIRNGLGFIGRFQRLVDWTSGCMSVTNPEIEEIFRAVRDGTPIEIRP